MRSLSWSITTFRLRMNRRPEASAPALRAGLRPSPASWRRRRAAPVAAPAPACDAHRCWDRSAWSDRPAARRDVGSARRGRAAARRGELTIGLRAGLDLFAAREVGEQGGEALGG